MTRLLKKRGFRCATCLTLIGASVAFLWWDAGRLSESPVPWIPGPAYLVFWLGSVVSGILATLGLFLDGCFAIRKTRRAQVEVTSELMDIREAGNARLLSGS